MPVVELTFPVGRFHGTPWGRHVNEGAAEWPPSPWRILRALIATWHLKAQEDVSRQTMHSLILTLAQKAPRYWIPPATCAHTRHYMPYNAGKNEKTTKVFDTFVQLAPDDPLLVFWGQELADEELQALRVLVDRLGYCGRAESLVQGRVVEDVNGHTPNVMLMEGQGQIDGDKELVRLLAPMSNEQYLAWRQQYTSDNPGSAQAKGSKRGSRKSALELPDDISTALLAQTDQLQAAGWSLPPGSTTLDYLRPTHCFEVAPIHKRKSLSRLPTVARFAVVSQVMPRMIQAVAVADRMHKALLSRFPDGAPEIFSGRDNLGKPLRGNRHAFIFSESSERHDAISHITIFVRTRPDGTGGFNDVARQALRSIRKVWGHGGHDLQLVLLGLGQPDDFCKSPLFGESAIWESLTPFVATRHAKCYRDGRPKCDPDGWHIGSPAHDLRRLIAEAGLPLPIKLEPLKSAKIRERPMRWLQFQTQRPQSSAKHPQQPPCGFRLVFAERVRGPLAFGYCAHFGLGLFVPAG